MWLIPSQSTAPPLPKRFALLLTLYVLTALGLVTWNSVLSPNGSPFFPKKVFRRSVLGISFGNSESNRSNQVQEANRSEKYQEFDESYREIPNFTESYREISTSPKNASRRSNSTQVRPRGEENRLFFHWIPDMRSVWDASKGVLWPWGLTSSRFQTNCTRFNVHFALPMTFRPRALVSFPGSGDPLLRYLLERVTGIFTGSVFKGSSFGGAGFLGDSEPFSNGRTILQATHHDTAFEPQESNSAAHKRKQGLLLISDLLFEYRGILLVRNPFDAIVVYWQYLKTKNLKFSMTDFSLLGVDLWARLIETWVMKSRDFILVRYEDLNWRPREELSKILAYLSLPLDENRLSCTLESLKILHRKMSKMELNSRNTISGKMKGVVEKIEMRVEKVNEMLNAQGLPSLEYKFEDAEMRAFYADEVV